MGVSATGAAAAGGKSKGSGTNTFGHLGFHASGTMTKATGGLEIYGSNPYGYFSGKVKCYDQEGTASAAFGAEITKADQPYLVAGDFYAIFWLEEDAFSYKVVTGDPCDESINEPDPQPLPIDDTAEGGYISLRV
jgi:hypothetical protein